MRKIFTTSSLLALFIAGAGVASAQSALQVADFENLDLAPESYWVGDTEDEDYDWGSFTSGSFEFANFYMADYGSWAFYGYSNLTSTEYTGGYALDQQMMNCVGSGHDSSTFGIGYCDAYWGPSVITIPDFPEGVQVNGMWVTNTAWVVDAILNGDGMSDAFATGDYLKLTITGTDADGDTKSVDFYLADYRSENTDDHYYVKEWRYFDLSSLGEVVKLVPSIESTKKNSYGMTTPAYFSFDDLGAVNTQSGIENVAADLDVRVAVADGIATVTSAVADFEVEAVSVTGIRAAAVSSNGVASVRLPAAGVNIVRVVSGTATKVVKVINF